MELSLRRPKMASSSIPYLTIRIGSIYRNDIYSLAGDRVSTRHGGWARHAIGRDEGVGRLPRDVTSPADRLGWGGLADPRPHVGGRDPPEPRLADRAGRQGNPHVHRP